ncbi:helix-turn-helix protein [Clavibacter michiganensis subsp. michiganensis]|uniref:helix-turn-helix domain-containing protein n=1 Tax=Clavibacter michiganensis TaxID=28447 RepID=UPI000B711294|nr:helix-turn-helix transcriptional regulator [Clavibacter michiganensis]OUD99755.1 helix-turn-helix protein [Clavibacter michiganensis subsp. michiganensis]
MNPQMLTLLRESRGYSGAQLAKLAGIPQPTLSKMENGLAVIDEARLRQLADALDYPVDAFNWTDPIYGFGSPPSITGSSRLFPRPRSGKFRLRST